MIGILGGMNLGRYAVVVRVSDLYTRYWQRRGGLA
jgi:hypothetical protein